MAGHDDGNGVSPVRKPHRAHALRIADLARNLRIASGLAIGNARQRRPHAFLKGRSLRRQREFGKIPLPALEIARQRVHCAVEMRARIGAAVPLRE